MPKVSNDDCNFDQPAESVRCFFCNSETPPDRCTHCGLDPAEPLWYCTDLCDHEASVYQCELNDGDRDA